MERKETIARRATLIQELESLPNYAGEDYPGTHEFDYYDAMAGIQNRRHKQELRQQIGQLNEQLDLPTNSYEALSE